jgi:transcriptional regulator GlxA family with amidase domain
MLSAKDASVAQVARVVGYGSSIAMCRAFRDAKLPSPGAVQRALSADEVFTPA